MAMLYIVSTPIGNLEDITIRAIKTLFSADAILCEDTRRTGFLMSELIKRYGEQFDMEMGSSPKLIQYYDEIEEKKLPEVIELLEQGKDLALVSDAGTPLVSDPGFRLVRQCAKSGIPVESIPGPSAILAALTSSGLPPDKFTFLGFVNKKNFPYVTKDVTAIFYSAPHKLLQDVSEIKNAFGDIDIVIARELTKVHEEIWRGKISEAQQYFKNPQGEFVLLFNIPRA